MLLNGLSFSPFRGCFGQVLFSPVFDCGFQNGAKIRFAHFCKNFPAFAGFCKISIAFSFLRICAPFTISLWQISQDLCSSLSVSQSFWSVGTPPPARHGCSCAGASYGDALLFSSAVHVQPSLCTRSIGRRSGLIL